MIRLLKANFYKLKKDNIFWLINFISFGLALFALYRFQSFRGIITLDRIATDLITSYLGIFIAFFVAIFVGKEYADGTIRNKIISGHKRTHIYLANLIVCVIAGLISELIYIFTIFLIGKNMYGQLQMMSLLKIILYTILIIIAYCSIYNFLAMLCANLSISIVVCIIAFVLMFVINATISQKIYISKYLPNVIIYDETGPMQLTDEKRPNPNYPSKQKMRIYKSIYFLTPNGQASTIYSACTERIIDDEEQEDIIRQTLIEMPIYSICIILILNIAGICLFKRQEIR